MDQKIVVYPKTKVIAEGEQIETTLTIDLCNLTEQDIIAYAIDSLTIKWQTLARKGSIVPTEATYIPNKPGTRLVKTVNSLDVLKKLFDMNQVYALLKKYGDADKAVAAIKPLIDSLMENTVTE
jgi:hypothetical protein